MYDGERGCLHNCECLRESMLHDLDPINVHGALYLKTFNPLTPVSICARPTRKFLALIIKYFRPSESTEINHMHSNQRHGHQVSRHGLSRVQ